MTAGESLQSAVTQVHALCQHGLIRSKCFRRVRMCASTKTFWRWQQHVKLKAARTRVEPWASDALHYTQHIRAPDGSETALGEGECGSENVSSLQVDANACVPAWVHSR